MSLLNIAEEYPYKTELHSHSYPVSACAKLSADFNARIYATLGCDTLTLTNHLKATRFAKYPRHADLAEFYLADYYKAQAAVKDTETCVALGIELAFPNDPNDYLLYGIKPCEMEKIIYYLDKDIHTFYREFKNDHNLIIHAHPFRNNTLPTPLDSVDGVEVFNFQIEANGRIATAARYAYEHDLLVTCGSDYHEPGRAGLIYMRTRNKLHDSLEVAEAIKSRDVIFDTFGNLIIPYQ